MQSDDCLANGNLGGASCEQATVLWVRLSAIESFQSVHLVVVIIVVGFVEPPRQHVDGESLGTSFL